MSDALVQQLELMAAYLERFGKIEEARYVRQVIEEYCHDQEKCGRENRRSENCGEQV